MLEWWYSVHCQRLIACLSQQCSQYSDPKFVILDVSSAGVTLHVWQHVNHQPPGGQRSKHRADSWQSEELRETSVMSLQQVEVQVWSNKPVVDRHVCYCEDEILQIFSPPARLTRAEWLHRRSLTHERESVCFREVFGFLFSFFLVTGLPHHRRVCGGFTCNYRPVKEGGTLWWREDASREFNVYYEETFVFRNASSALNTEQQLVMKQSEFISPVRNTSMSETIDSLGRIPTYLGLRSHKVKTVFMAAPEERSCSVNWWRELSVSLSS